MPSLKLLAAAACLALVPTAAPAADVLWTLTGVTLDDGGTASGSFVYNADTQTIGAFTISVQGGNTRTFPAFTWNGTTANAVIPDLFSGFNFVALTGTREFRVDPLGSLTNAGGTVALDLGSLYGGDCFNCTPSRLVTAGSLVGRAVAGAVPEPATWGMMLLGFAAVGAQFRRRRTARATLRAA